MTRKSHLKSSEGNIKGSEINTEKTERKKTGGITKESNVMTQLVSAKDCKRSLKPAGRHKNLRPSALGDSCLLSTQAPAQVRRHGGCKCASPEPDPELKSSSSSG